MGKKQTQEERVVEMLEKNGEVDNFWAMHNYILRLGAIIFQLRQTGWEFEGKYGKALGRHKRFNKNFYYIVTKKP